MSNDASNDEDSDQFKCELCDLSYPCKKDLNEHCWSLMHHVNIEHEKKHSEHNCTLCFTKCQTIGEYRKHLSGEKHKTALEESKKTKQTQKDKNGKKKQGKNRKSRWQPNENTEEKGSSDMDLEDPSEFDSGFSRDPVFYRKKKNRSQSENEDHQNLVQTHPRWGGPSSTQEPPYQNYGNGGYQNQMYDNDYFQNDSYSDDFGGHNDFRFNFGRNNEYRDHYGRPNFSPRNRFHWYSIPPPPLQHPPPPLPPPPPQYGNYGGPSLGAGPNSNFYQFDRSGTPVEKEGTGEEESSYDREESSWNRNSWNNMEPFWNNYDDQGGGRRNSMEDNQYKQQKEGGKGWKNGKKKKGKGNGQGKKGNGQGKKANKVSPGSNGRKRCRDSESDLIASKSFRHNENVSDECGSLSSSIRSTSSNGKSSNKSKSNNNSPTVRLKSLGAKKLQNSRFSPKNIRVSPKVLQMRRKGRKEDDQTLNNSGSGVLEKAEKLCKDLREKRQKAKKEQEKIAKAKKNNARDALNQVIMSLNTTNMSRIKGHLSSYEKEFPSSDTSNRESGIATFSSSQNSVEACSSLSGQGSSTRTLVSHKEPLAKCPNPVFQNDIDRIRHSIESSVRMSVSSPAKASTSQDSPPVIPPGKRPLTKDSLLKMVNSPRSRNERMHLARMLRTHTKSQNKLAPSRLNVQLNGIYDNYDFDEEDIPAISLEDLSPEVKLQIAQLIEDEVNIDNIDKDDEPSGSRKLEAMEALAGYVSAEKRNHTATRDDALQIEDLVSPENLTSAAHPNSIESRPEPPQQIPTNVSATTCRSSFNLPESTVTSNSQLSQNSDSVAMDTEQPGGRRESERVDTSSASPLMSAMEFSRRALQLTTPERPASVLNTSHDVPTSTLSPIPEGSGLQQLAELSVREEAVHGEMAELEQRMEMMRQMLRRTLEHLDKHERRRKELMEDTRQIRCQRQQILRGMTNHSSVSTQQQSRGSPQHLAHSSNQSDNEVVMDTVSSTSHTQLEQPVTSPAHLTASPSHPTTSPAHLTASPTHPTTSPAHLTASPAHPTASPAHKIVSPAPTYPRSPGQRDLISPPATRGLQSPAPRDVSAATKEPRSPTLRSSSIPSRPVSISTVSVENSSFAQESADTNPALSQPSSRDDRHPTSIAPTSCVMIKQERVTPPPDASPPRFPCLNLSKPGDGSTVVSRNCWEGTEETGQSSPGVQCERVGQESVTKATGVEEAISIASSSPTSTVLYSISPSSSPDKGDRLASLSSWSPLADRLASIQGSSSKKRTKSVDSVMSVGKFTNSEITAVNNPATRVLFSSPADRNGKGDLEKSKDSGIGSIFSVPRRSSETEKDSSQTVRSRTVSESSDCDTGKKSSMPMAYLGSISTGEGTAAVLKKLAADLGSLGSVNTMSCVMLDRHDVTDKMSSVTRTRTNSESSAKSLGTDVHLMELDLKSDVSGKESTPREESDHGSARSITSLGEKIRMYCQDNRPHQCLDPIDAGCSDGDRTLQEEDMIAEDTPESDNTPGKVLKHCSVVLQKLELEKNGEQEDDEVILIEDDVLRDMTSLKGNPESSQHMNIEVDQSKQQTEESVFAEMKGPASPGKKKRKTKKERDILTNRKAYWFDSSSDNNSQEDDNVPKLSSLKQQLVFTQREDNSSEPDHEDGKRDAVKASWDTVIVEEALTSKGDAESVIKDSKVSTVCASGMTDSPLLKRSEEKLSHSVSPQTSLSSIPSHATFTGPKDPVVDLQLVSDHVYVCYQAGNIRRFNLQSGELSQTYNCSYHSVQCMSVISTPGRDDQIFAGGLSFHLIVFNGKSPHIAHSHEFQEELKCLHHDAGILYVGLTSGSVEVFDVKNLRHKDSYQCAYQAIHCISSAREGGSKLLCVSAQDTTISVCDARSGLPVRILSGHKKTSFSVMSSDHFVFSGSGDRTVMMHNLHTGKLEYTFKDHGGIITCVWVEGNSLYSAGYDRLVRCFDIKNRTLKKMYYGAGKDVIMSLAVYGNKLFTGSREGVVECIELSSESWPCQTPNCHHVFGLKEHLLHHLLTEHSQSSSKLMRCTWKDCSDWLTLHRDDGSVELHMRKHVESLEGTA